VAEAAVLSFAGMKRIFVARDPQDMRRGIDTLSCVVEHELGHEPYTGDCFIFLSRDRKKLKVLVWEDGGFWLCLKRLVTGTFAAVSSWNTSTAPTVVVTPALVHALIEGIDMKTLHFRARTRVDGMGSSRQLVEYGRGRDDPSRAGRAHDRRGGHASRARRDGAAARCPGAGQAGDREAADGAVRGAGRDQPGGALG
jgi:transposase